MGTEEIVPTWHLESCRRQRLGAPLVQLSVGTTVLAVRAQDSGDTLWLCECDVAEGDETLVAFGGVIAQTVGDSGRWALAGQITEARLVRVLVGGEPIPCVVGGHAWLALSHFGADGSSAQVEAVDREGRITEQYEVDL